MTFDETAQVLGLQIPERVARACRSLERRGLKFCAHFGYENAVELASCRHSWRWR